MTASNAGQFVAVPISDRLTAGLEHRRNGCLEWTGSTSAKGYGRIWSDGKVRGAHRIAWELVNGPIPDGLFVCHHCDNPPCCETSPSEAYPDGHLFLGTDADNYVDMVMKGRGKAAKTHCLQKHEYTEANTYIRRDGARECRSCRATWRLSDHYPRRR